MTAFRTQILRARESFWFLPALLGIAALVLAQSLIYLDRFIDDKQLGGWGFLLYRVGASGSRDILGAIIDVRLDVAVSINGRLSRRIVCIGLDNGDGRTDRCATRIWRGWGCDKPVLAYRFRRDGIS